MKIGIVTFHQADNYGAVLQCYALCKVMRDKGAEVMVADYRSEAIIGGYRLIPKWKHSIYQWLRRLMRTVLYLPAELRRKKKFKEFREQYLPIHTDKEWDKNEVYITGSDQVWNTEITHGIDNVYTLKYVPDGKRKVSYAASVGKFPSDIKEKEELIQRIGQLDAISVREETVKKELGQYISRQITVSLDPTLLLKKIQWDKIAGEEPCIKEEYILYNYVEPDPRLHETAKYMGQITDCKLIVLSLDQKSRSIASSEYARGPKEYLNLIKYAKGVITSSFHTVVFSIIFEKPFYAVPTKETGSRVTDLCKRLGISQCIVSSQEQCDSYEKLQIDYRKVKEKLEIFRMESMDYIDREIMDAR